MKTVVVEPGADKIGGIKIPLDKRPPMEAQDLGSHPHRGKPYRFFKCIAWHEWWDEFLRATQPNGALKYRTAWSFAKGKGKTNWERKLIYEIIGPHPKAGTSETERTDSKQLRAPWLGDWQRRRANGFWGFDDPMKMRVINQALKNRADAWESVRAVAPFIIVDIARWAKLAEQIDQAFAGQPFLPNEPPTSSRNRRRFRTFFNMHRQVSEQLILALREYMKLFGFDPNYPDYWLHIVQMSGKSQEPRQSP